ncbi:MAG TPA: response regulator [Terriglobales bacterium]|nr:response regulator [Terriglobales bacterium]
MKTERARARLSDNGRKAVLVLDDEPIVLAVVTSALRTAGFDVLQAKTAKDAGTVFHTDAARLCLGLIDIELEGMSGVQFVQSLPTLTPRIPILFMTGLGTIEVEGLAPEDPVLYKPFTARTLLAAVENALFGDSRQPHAVE